MMDSLVQKWMIERQRDGNIIIECHSNERGKKFQIKCVYLDGQLLFINIVEMNVHLELNIKHTKNSN